MKKFLFMGLVVALLLSLTVAVVGAAPLGEPGERDGVRNLSGQGAGPAYGFVDENQDGVNDRFVDANADGECDQVGQAQGAGYGRSAQANGTARPANGTGRQANAAGQQRGQGAGAMARFVDADGNGICDYLEQN
ncbi:MAG: hypothetical protein ACYC4L_11110 [Chloroflexota bacterium]